MGPVPRHSNRSSATAGCTAAAPPTPRGRCWHTCGALRAYLAGDHGVPPVNLKLLVEGAEEVGSPAPERDPRRHADRLAADLVIVSDTMTWAADQPAICVSNRGPRRRPAGDPRTGQRRARRRGRRRSPEPGRRAGRGAGPAARCGRPGGHARLLRRRGRAPEALSRAALAGLTGRRAGLAGSDADPGAGRRAGPVARRAALHPARRWRCWHLPAATWNRPSRGVIPSSAPGPTTRQRWPRARIRPGSPAAAGLVCATTSQTGSATG